MRLVLPNLPASHHCKCRRDPVSGKLISTLTITGESTNHTATIGTLLHGARSGADEAHVPRPL